MNGRDDELKEIKRTPGAGYIGLDATDAPGWDEAECERCGLADFLAKDIEQCEEGHLICDDCADGFDRCPLCDAGDEDGGEA